MKTWLLACGFRGFLHFKLNDELICQTLPLFWSSNIANSTRSEIKKTWDKKPQTRKKLVTVFPFHWCFKVCCTSLAPTSGKCKRFWQTVWTRHRNWYWESPIFQIVFEKDNRTCQTRSSPNNLVLRLICVTCKMYPKWSFKFSETIAVNLTKPVEALSIDRKKSIWCLLLSMVEMAFIISVAPSFSSVVLFEIGSSCYIKCFLNCIYSNTLRLFNSFEVLVEGHRYFRDMLKLSLRCTYALIKIQVEHRAETNEKLNIELKSFILPDGSFSFFSGSE